MSAEHRVVARNCLSVSEHTRTIRTGERWGRCHASVGYRTVGSIITAHNPTPPNSGCLHQCCYRTCPRKQVTACSRGLPGLSRTLPFQRIFRFLKWWSSRVPGRALG